MNARNPFEVLILIHMGSFIKTVFLVGLRFTFKKNGLIKIFSSKGSFITFFLFFFSPSVEARIKDLWGYPVGEAYPYVQVGHFLPALVSFRSRSFGTLKLRKEAYRSFLALKQKAVQQNINLSLFYAYRTLSTQQRLYKKLGKKQAEKVRYSEHHLGTAVDLVGVTFSSETFLWLLKYGISAGWVPTYYYRKNSRFIKEPWHWRYVGKIAAKKFYLSWKKNIDRDIYVLQNLNRKGKLKKSLP